jgi:hypothetical protein
MMFLQMITLFGLRVAACSSGDGNEDNPLNDAIARAQGKLYDDDKLEQLKEDWNQAGG